MTLFIVLLFTLVFHTYLAYFISKSKNDPHFEGQTNVYPMANSEIEDEELVKKGLMKQAKLMNTIAKVAFIIFLIVFNIGFWSIALIEHFRPAEYYITEQ